MKVLALLFASTQAISLDRHSAVALPPVNGMVMWHQAPDYGELDPSVINRANGLNAPAGWVNPLSVKDDGAGDDNLVV